MSFVGKCRRCQRYWHWNESVVGMKQLTCMQEWLHYSTSIFSLPKPPWRDHVGLAKGNHGAMEIELVEHSVTNEATNAMYASL